MSFALAVGCDAPPPDDDAGTDAGSIIEADSGTDAGSPDAGTDAGPADSGGIDAGADAGVDGGMDGGMDAGPDGGTDAGPDGGTDAGPRRVHLVVRLIGVGSGSVAGPDIACDGSAGASCDIFVDEGTSVSLTATADDDSVFSSWSDSNCVGATCDVVVNDDLVLDASFGRRTLSVLVETTGDGSVQVDPQSDTCTGTCSYTVDYGSVLAFTANAGSGSELATWTDACAAVGSAPVCVLTIEADTTVRAGFAVVSDGVTVVRAGDGDGAITSAPAGIDCGATCAATFARGTDVTLTAAAAEGSDFEGWSGDCSGTSTCPITVDGSSFAVASFRLRRYRLGVSRGGTGVGHVGADVGAIDCGSTCEDTYGHGTTVQLTATPDVSSTFGGWGGACAGAGMSLTCDVAMTAAMDATASFTLRTFDLAASVTGSGAGSISSSPTGISCGLDCLETYDYGAVVTLTASVDASSTFDGWGGDCSGTGTCVLSMTAARTASAGFTIRSYPLNVTVNATGGGGGTVTATGIDCGSDCTETYEHGTMVSLSVAADDGSRFLGWSGACTGIAACVVTMDQAQSVTGSFVGFEPTRLSETDKHSELILSDDRLTVHFQHRGGVRSEMSVAPGDGVFYFEGSWVTDRRGPFGVGVATDELPVSGSSSIVGGTTQSYGVNSAGNIDHNGFLTFRPLVSDTFGFVLDYRGATPIMHLILENGGGTPVVYNTRSMPTVTTPLFIYIAGERRVHDVHVRINPGNDTTNLPFYYDPDAVLRSAGLTDEADALVPGWRATYAGPADDPTVLTPSADQAVTSGTPVTLTATAIDTEDGDIGSSITWEVLSTPHYADRLTGTGTTFDFTPVQIGLHPVRVRVRDSAGQRSEAIVTVEVTDAVPQADPVILVPDALTGVGIELGADNVSARFTGFGKMGIRANQGLYGEFWYFEITRHVAVVNQGGGVTTGDGDLNAYDWFNVPGSASINTQGGCWHGIINRADWPNASSTYSTYGFAVDYRGTQPILYYILDDAVVYEVLLDDVWTALYPMVYGNPTNLTVTGEVDSSINFGATAFTWDPTTALTNHGVDTTEFEEGWGDANTP